MQVFGSVTGTHFYLVMGDVLMRLIIRMKTGKKGYRPCIFSFHYVEQARMGHR
jgi:hypothetical protein